MQERDIVSVDPIEDSPWSEETSCSRSDRRSRAVCSNTADKVIEQTYDDEPDKTFYTLLCESCASEYLKKWDHAKIFGE